MAKSKSKSENTGLRLPPLCCFLIFIIAIMVIFFGFVFHDVEVNTESTILSNVGHQNQNFQNIINQHFQYLEGIAHYIGTQGELNSAENFDLLSSLTEKSTISLMAIIDADGVSRYADGHESSVLSKDYFQEAMAGERTLSRPAESQIDGQLRIILAVPIRHEDEVIGVLAGSCNLSTLGQMLLADIYPDSGYLLIADSDGSVVSHGTERIEDLASTEANFFDQLEGAQFSRGASAERIRKDFAAQESGIVSFSLGQNSNSYYLAYKPFGMENWMFCYVVPVSTAQQEYYFITHYGVLMFLALVIGTSVFLGFVFWSNNRTQHELLRLGQSDALTGLFNKQITEEMIQKWFDGDQKNGLQAMMMMDIDHFKEINDTYGHAAGDTILHEIGAIIRHEFRESDILGRVGGDEFCILMKNILSAENATDKAERLRSHIRSHVFPELNGDSVTTSIGVAFSPDHGENFNELYRTADAALYQAKRSGRDGYAVYGEE